MTSKNSKTVVAVLPETFRPYEVDELVRIGRAVDGGYIVNAEDVRNSHRLLSFGINDDWSFEEDFLARNAVPLLAYDGGISSVYFLKRAAIAFFKFYRPQSFLHWIKVFTSYSFFFQGDRVHEKKFVGRFRDLDYVSLTDALSRFHDSKTPRSTFLKVDIEGHEYRFLDELIEHEHKLSGIAIEFHDVDLHLENIERFISRFSLKLVHVHANNYSPISAEGVPLALECSFSSSVNAAKLKTQSRNDLDQPNNPRAPDIELNFDRGNRA